MIGASLDKISQPGPCAWGSDIWDCMVWLNEFIDQVEERNQHLQQHYVRTGTSCKKVS